MITKTDDGSEYSAAAYAYVPDPDQPSTWKLRIEEEPGAVTVEQLGRAAAALSPGGFRGQRVEIPAEDVPRVKARIRAEYHKLDVTAEEIPESVRATEVRPFLVTLAALADLARIPLAMLGRWIKGSQKFSITREDIRAMVANFRKRQADTLIDYDHATATPEVAAGGPVPAAGWLKEVEDAPDAAGIWWGLAEFTVRARQMIEAGELRYLSPAILWGSRDKHTGEQQGARLVSVGVTNTPFLDAMPAIQLSEGWREQTTESGDMPEKEQSVSEQAKQQQKQEPRVVRLTDVPRDETTGLYDFARVPASSEVEDVVYASDVFMGRHKQERAVALVDQAVKEGKILPANRGEYLKLALHDFESVKAIIERSKPQVDLTERGVAGTGEEGTKATELAQVDQQIRELADKRIAVDKSLSLGQAVKLVLSERPDLRARRAKLMQR